MILARVCARHEERRVDHTYTRTHDGRSGPQADCRSDRDGVSDVRDDHNPVSQTHETHGSPSGLSG